MSKDSMQQYNVRLDELLTSLFDGYNHKGLILMFDWGNPAKPIPMYFTPMAFFQQLSSCNSMEFIGYIDGGDESYLIIKILDNTGAKKIQLIPLIVNSSGVVHMMMKPKNTDAYNMLLTSEVGLELAKKYFK
jgi:cobalamin biosynthesis Co2+ chelatase CbiK